MYNEKNMVLVDVAQTCLFVQFPSITSKITTSFKKWLDISRILLISKTYVPTIVSQETNHHENCKWLTMVFDVNVKQ